MNTPSDLSSAIVAAFSQAAASVINAVTGTTGTNSTPCLSNNPNISQQQQQLLHPTTCRTSTSGRQQTHQSTPTSSRFVDAFGSLANNFGDSDDDFVSIEPKPKHARFDFWQPSKTGNRQQSQAVKGGRMLRKNSSKSYTREIFALPPQYLHQYRVNAHQYRVNDGLEEAVYKIPRGNPRKDLMLRGLSAKIAICKQWSEREVRSEISKLFRNCFHSAALSSTAEDELKFDYLCGLPSTKLLKLPKVNNAFVWDGAAVLSLNRSIIYIAISDNFELLSELQCITIEIAQEEEEDRTSINDTSEDNKEGITGENAATELEPNQDVLPASNEQPSGSDIVGDAATSHQTLNYSNYIGALSDPFSAAQSSASGDEKSDIHDFERETADQNDDELDYCLLLQQIRDTIDDDHSIQFNINRLKILDGAVRAIKRKTFCDHPMGRLDIKFSDSFGSPESAIDAGGPTREFLRLLTSAVMRSPVFEGPANARILTRNETAAAKDLYYIYGVCVGLSLVHGGPGVHCMSPVLYNQLVDKPRNYIEALPSMIDCYAHSKLLKIKDAEGTDEILASVAEAEDYLLLSGCTYAVMSRPSKASEVVSTGVKFYVEDRVKAEVKRFAEGLEKVRVLNAMICSPNSFKQLFCEPRKPLTAAQLTDDLFLPIFSESGSNRRMKENEVLAYWRDYVLDTEETEERPSIKDILAFATGADSVPPLGFLPTPTLEFDDSSKYPIGNTCGNVLKIPLEHSSYDEFKESMDYGIKNCAGFGLV